MAVIVHRDGRLVVGGQGKDFTLSELNQGSVVRYGGSSLTLTGFEASYSYIYKKQLWVYTVVNKIAYGAARLPLPVYERSEKGRPRADKHPYAELLRKPNDRMDPVTFWLWTASTFLVYGNAFWHKQRMNGQVKELWPIHPANMTIERDGSKVKYLFGTDRREIPAEDLVHFRTYNPDSLVTGLSPLEPLRQTLLNEDAARRATSAFWLNGARPGFALKHPGQLTEPAAARLRNSFDEVHAGTDSTGKTVVLEEGMEAQVLQLSAEEAQYIETRKLNREEVCGAYDVPPPVVHILDRATYSNITEQMRSMYRDTMAPKLRVFESTLESQLRPEFGDEVYAEFLMDEVLRGAFEARAEAYQKAINSGWMTPADVRRSENLEFIEGSDRLFMNSASVPMVNEFERARFDAVGILVRSGYAPDAAVAAVGLPPIEHSGLAPVTVQNEEEQVSARSARTVLGRLSRVHTLEDVDQKALVHGLNGDAGKVLAALAESQDVQGFKERLKVLGGVE